MFRTLKEEFQVPDTYELALHHVDAAESCLTNTVDIAVITMRKIQALRWVAKPSVGTTNDIVVALAADLLRALDHLVKYCNDQANADSLTRFKHQIMVAARHAGGDIDPSHQLPAAFQRNSLLAGLWMSGCYGL